MRAPQLVLSSVLLLPFVGCAELPDAQGNAYQNSLEADHNGRDGDDQTAADRDGWASDQDDEDWSPDRGEDEPDDADVFGVVHQDLQLDVLDLVNLPNVTAGLALASDASWGVAGMSSLVCGVNMIQGTIDYGEEYSMPVPLSDSDGTQVLSYGNGRLEMAQIGNNGQINRLQVEGVVDARLVGTGEAQALRQVDGQCTMDLVRTAGNGGTDYTIISSAELDSQHCSDSKMVVDPDRQMAWLAAQGELLQVEGDRVTPLDCDDCQLIAYSPEARQLAAAQAGSSELSVFSRAGELISRFDLGAPITDLSVAHDSGLVVALLRINTQLRLVALEVDQDTATIVARRDGMVDAVRGMDSTLGSDLITLYLPSQAMVIELR